ncbi:chloride channel protein [Alteromonas sp. a30]|uniref:chloride channel protein n=1 Tax=Alteromonas sp. a30 TaxID=2730917 RepID=UPI0022818DC4|nr:chloride channel protein [Alteromonas sp. a30]MCY7294617.1 chloride channel protein [Alteromonas sp. a30]
MCLLGIIAGICSAFVIILFRLGYESIQLQYLDDVEKYASLAPEARLILPIIGALCIAAFAFITGFRHYRLGIPFIIHRVKLFYGTVPFRTALNQFFGGMFALASGFSVGREGPSVHLGAATSSFFGTLLKLPYNAVRILAGCGISAGIAASFNTPFAAVIFVMEVVLREYRIHIFIPVMLAAACGSVITRSVFGNTHELAFLNVVGIHQGWILAYLIPFGMVLGVAATFFNKQLMHIIKAFRPVSMARRLILAGIITGLIGFVIPEAMGTGLSPVHLINDMSHDMQLLLMILIAKVILTLFAIGLGIPGGVIGPILGIGVLAGVLLLLPLKLFMPETEHLTSSFALLGMAGLLTSVLNAPLAALSFIMELSHTTGVILPAMLVIVPSFVTASQFLKNRSIFIKQLDFQKLPYKTTFINESLQKIGVMAAIDKEFKLFHDAQESTILEFLDTAPTHPVVQQSFYEIDVTYQLVQYDMSLDPHSQTPLTYYPMQGVPAQATMAEVYDILQRNRQGAVYVYRNTAENIVGVITWDCVRHYINQQHY